ncbi:MAG: LPXTG cell wall anchor domain-containing protein [Actinomycetota bacterium]
MSSADVGGDAIPRSRRRWGMVVAAVAGLLAVSAAPAGAATAGDVSLAGLVNVSVSATGANALQVLEGATVELYDSNNELLPGEPCTTTTDPAEAPNSALLAQWSVQCTAVFGAYTIGIDGVPAGSGISASCFDGNQLIEMIENGTPEFTIGRIDAECFIRIDLPTVFIDKDVQGAPTSDFDLEVYGGGGELAATATDPEEAFCLDNDGFIDLNNFGGECATAQLPAGNYQLGESGPVGFLPTAVWCRSNVLEERFPDGVGEFQLSTDFQTTGASPFVYCRIVNEPFDGRVVVEKVVVNDDGGSATPDDFTAEVFREGDGMLQASGDCAADGSCIDTALPIGPYRIGETGPDGYDATVACVVTVQPDPPSIDTQVPNADLVDTEALPGADAAFDIEPFGEVTCTITNDDRPQPTTTTAAPTTTPPPPPTTMAAQLPATGNGDTAWQIAALGGMMLLAGSALLAVRRRP